MYVKDLERDEIYYFKRHNCYCIFLSMNRTSGYKMFDFRLITQLVDGSNVFENGEVISLYPATVEDSIEPMAGEVKELFDLTE